MSVNQARLLEELHAAGLTSTNGTSTPKKEHPTPKPSTYHTRTSDGILVRVDWSATPSAPDQTTAETVVQAHDGSQTSQEKYLEAFSGRGDRVLGGLVLKASPSNWNTLSSAQKSEIQDLIDAAAAEILAVILS